MGNDRVLLSFGADSGAALHVSIDVAGESGRDPQLILSLIEYNAYVQYAALTVNTPSLNRQLCTFPAAARTELGIGTFTFDTVVETRGQFLLVALHCGDENVHIQVRLLSGSSVCPPGEGLVCIPHTFAVVSLLFCGDKSFVE